MQRSHGGWLRLLDPCVLFAERPEVCEARTPEVSAWSVGEQLEHLVLADRGILQAVQELTEPGANHGDAAATGGPTIIGRVILWTGFIPRGRGKAPDFAKPSGMSSADLAAELGEIRSDVEALGSRLGEIERIPAVRTHPVGLGSFTPAQWMRFAFVHHVHHAKIIRDILKDRASE
jgi:uncharacterized damage-inducible protein DinB